MTLNDPLRPQMSGRPAYGSPPIAVLPELLFWPTGGGLTRISAFLATGDNNFSRFEALWDTAMVPVVLREYRDDPEALLAKLFSWAPPRARAKAATVPQGKSQVSLSDLGFDL